MNKYNLILNRLNLLAIDHKTCSLAIREKFTFFTNELHDYLELLQQELGYLVILSTCNRTEIYISSDYSPFELREKIIVFLQREKQVQFDVLDGKKLFFHGENVAERLFRITSGLESMILGEGQILSQVKKSYLEAKNYTDSLLNQLFQRAIATGKKVRTQTSIARGAVSVPSACIEIIKQKTTITNQQIVLIGSGEMSKLTYKLLLDQEILPENICLLSKRENIDELKKDFPKIQNIKNRSELNNLLKTTNIIIACTDSRSCVLNKQDLEENQINHDLIICDMGVPRNISPDVAEYQSVFLLDLDYLQKTVEQSLNNRKKESQKAEQIIQEEKQKFFQWCLNKHLFKPPTP